MATTTHHLHARCTRCGRIAIAVPTPGIAAPSAGCTACDCREYRLATAAEVEAVPDGSTMAVIELPVTWEAEARRDALLAKPMFVLRAEDDYAYGWPTGWLSIIERLVSDIETLPSGATAQAVQVKDKFAELRFYGKFPDGAGPLIQAAIAESRHTCKWCGDTGERVEIGGWWTALCHRHHAVAKLAKHQDLSPWRHLLALPVDLPARPHLNAAWAAVMAADQLIAIGAEVIGISVPGDLAPLDPVGVYVGAGSDAARAEALVMVQRLLGNWPVKPYHRGDCQRLARLDDSDIRRHAQLAVHPLMANGAKLMLGNAGWLPIIEQLLADLATVGVPRGRIKAIRPAQDGRLSVHPTLTGEAARLVREADRAAELEAGRAG